MNSVSITGSTAGYGGPFYVFIMDRQGRYVWYSEMPNSRLTLFAQISSDGRYILYEGSTHYVYHGPEPIVIKSTLDRRYYETIDLPGLGFSFDEIPGGVLLYDKDGVHHELVERQPDGTERTVWDCDAYMSANGLSASCAVNSVVWIPATDTVLWSMYNSDTIVQVDRKSGQALRQLGQLSGGWTFDPPESVVDYQHYPSFTPDGNLIVSTHIYRQSGEQRAREWVLDDKIQTATQVWSYGEEVDNYATYGGEAFRLENGNTMICYGTDGGIREVTMEKKTAWEVEWPLSSGYRLLGHSTLIDDLYALNQGPEEVAK